MFAVQRAYEIYMKPLDYNIIRLNAFESVIDVADVSRVIFKLFIKIINFLIGLG